MFIITFTFMFTFASMSNVDAHIRRRPDRCHPYTRKRKIFQNFCVFSSALDASLCVSIAFHMHPWKHILWHDKYMYTII